VVWPGTVEQKEQVEVWIQKVKETYPGQTIFVAGHGIGGKLAWLVLSQDGEKKMAGAGCGFLTEDLEADVIGGAPKAGFLVYQSLYDDQTPASASIRADRGQAFVGAPLKVVLKADIFGRFSQAWMEWIHSVDEHFSEELKKAD
jgi:pimeloyl-ACP methyl ester carboxylesterase